MILLGEHRVGEDAKRYDSGVGRSEDLCPIYGGVCAVREWGQGRDVLCR